MGNMIRLSKWISEQGLTSRRQADTWISEGRVKINSKIAVLGDKVDPETDVIYLDDKPVLDKAPPKVYWLLNKPDRTLCSHEKDGTKKRIFDLPKLKEVNFHLFSVGRLDYRTEGLLLLTNDGDLCHRLTHPKYKMPRHYMVLINGKLTVAEMRSLKTGVELQDGKAKCLISSAQGVNLGKSKGNWYYVTVYEGRNRLVRRLFEHFEHKVLKLVRNGFGDLRLDSKLKPGHYRQLTSAEIRSLKGTA